MGPAPTGLPPADEIGAWQSAVVDRLWDEAGRPDPFTVVQVAAGDGAVAMSMLDGPERAPACAGALRLVLVEPDPTLRERHAGRLPVEAPALFLGPVAASPDPDEDPVPVTGIGPIVTSLAELPVVRGYCVIVAVRWMSRFAHDLFEWRDERWYEVRLAAADSGGALAPIAVALDPARSTQLEALVPADRRVPGARYAVREGAASWLRSALVAGELGWVVVADRWAETTAPLGGSEPPLAMDHVAPVRRPDSFARDGLGGLGVACWRIG